MSSMYSGLPGAGAALVAASGAGGDAYLPRVSDLPQDDTVEVETASTNISSRLDRLTEEFGEMTQDEALKYLSELVEKNGLLKDRKSGALVPLPYAVKRDHLDIQMESPEDKIARLKQEQACELGRLSGSGNADARKQVRRAQDNLIKIAAKGE